MYDIINGEITVDFIREVSWKTCWGGEPVSLDTELVEASIQGKGVLVTGAGGSIGSGIVPSDLSL